MNKETTILQINTSQNPYLLQLTDKIFYAKKIILKEFFTFYNFYNVKNSDSTNTFTFEENGVGTYSITIPEGYYDVSSLISTMASLMTSSGTQTYNATQDPRTYKVSFATSGTTTWKFGVENIISRLGFGSTSFALTQTSTKIPIISSQFLTIRMFEINSDDKIYQNENMVNNLIYRIPIVYSNFGSLIYFQDINDSFYYTFKNGQIKNIKFQIYDMWDNLIDNNGCDFSFNIKIKARRKK